MRQAVFVNSTDDFASVVDREQFNMVFNHLANRFHRQRAIEIGVGTDAVPRRLFANNTIMVIVEYITSGSKWRMIFSY